MKFAHALKEALDQGDYPSTWVAAAVPYGKLKKCLKKAQQELKSIGLDEATITHLLDQEHENARATQIGSVVALEYEVDGEKKVIPKLTLSVHFENGVITDIALSPNTREYLQTLADKQKRTADSVVVNRTRSFDSNFSQDSLETHDVCEGNQHPSHEDLTIRTVEVPLTFTTKFFEILYDDVAELEKLQTTQQKALSSTIVDLSSTISRLSRPSKTHFHKSDLYRWRELFDIYLQANIFFSTRELDHGERTALAAAKQLEWFQTEVTRRGLVDAFKLPESRLALEQFVGINVEILKNLRFQEINKQAISKILKKYDKRTSLSARKNFPPLIKHDAIISGSVARDVCSQIGQDLVKIVPQFDEYSCPVCYEITYRPVRMKCGHVFCLDCACRLQEEHKKPCPVCRAPVVMEADVDNLDKELGKLIKKNFPREWRAAGIAQQTEDGINRFGPTYKHPKADKEWKEPDGCVVM